MIISKNNEKIKYLRKLQNNKVINEEKKFLVETENLVIEASKTGYLLETFSLDDVNYGVRNTVVSIEVMKSITNLKSVPKVVGVCKFIDENNNLGDKIIMLDNIQDPGNLGTIIRSACAFGISSIILSENCVNKYNDKVVRSSEGMLFQVNVVKSNLTTLIPNLINDGYDVYGSNVNNGIDIRNVNKSKKIAIIMGNEGNGISDEIKSMVDKNIYININNNCESLNVAVAASIIMYELGSDK